MVPMSVDGHYVDHGTHSINECPRYLYVPLVLLVPVSVLSVGVCPTCLCVVLVPSGLAWCLYVPTVSVKCIYSGISSLPTLDLKLVCKMGGHIIGRLQHMFGLMYFGDIYTVGPIAPLSVMRQFSFMMSWKCRLEIVSAQQKRQDRRKVVGETEGCKQHGHVLTWL